MTQSLSVLTILAAAGLVACNKEPQTTSTADASAAAVVANAAPGAPGSASATSANAPGPAGGAQSLPAEALKLVHTWNDALDKHDTAALGPLYAAKVGYYGTKTSGPAVVAMKTRALKGSSSFHQQIIGDITLEKSTFDGKPGMTAKFTKRSGSTKMSDVAATLVLAGTPLVIVDERDAASDAKQADKKIAACEAAAGEIVNAMPEVKKILADTEKELKKFPDRNMGGMGPLPGDEDTLFTSSIGVHSPERYEMLVGYSVDKSLVLHVYAQGDDLKIPAASQAKVATACK